MVGIAKDVNTSDLCGNTMKLIHVTPLLTITHCTCRPWLLPELAVWQDNLNACNC